MSDKKQSGRGFGGKGYYIALILCAAAIGISGYLYYRNANKDTNPENADQLGGVTAAATEEQQDVAAIATRPSGEATLPGTSESITPTAPKAPLKTAAPVVGETVAVYAMDSLGYNATTRDWRIHNGIDIAAAEGTAVCAAADGEVYTVYDDDTMGTTVVIRHDNGYTTKYASLSKEVTVFAGDTVKMGEAIGAVGTTALLESALGDHVHFSVTCNDEPMNPAEFLDME